MSMKQSKSKRRTKQSRTSAGNEQSSTWQAVQDQSQTQSDTAVSAEEGAVDPLLSLFHSVTASWRRAFFEKPTKPQRQGWPAIARGDLTLILAPTGTGKTLTAFLWCIDKLMLQPAPA
jgi:ATP-dependent Lhr-like helicase